MDCKKLIKKFFFIGCIYLLFFSTIVYAQVPWGIGHEHITTDLEFYDEKFGRFYQVYPIQINEKHVFCGKIVSADFVIQAQLYDDNDNLLFTEVSDSNLTNPHTLYFSQLIKTTGIYKILISTRDPGVKGKFSFDQYLFSNSQYFFDLKYSFCERLAFAYNHAIADFIFLKKSSNGQTDLILSDNSKGFTSNSPPWYENIVSTSDDQEDSGKLYVVYLSYLRSCLPEEYWNEYSEQKFLEGQFNSTLHTFTIKQLKEGEKKISIELIYKRNPDKKRFVIVLKVRP